MTPFVLDTSIVLILHFQDIFPTHSFEFSNLTRVSSTLQIRFAKFFNALIVGATLWRRFLQGACSSLLRRRVLTMSPLWLQFSHIPLRQIHFLPNADEEVSAILTTFNILSDFCALFQQFFFVSCWKSEGPDFSVTYFSSFFYFSAFGQQLPRPVSSGSRPIMPSPRKLLSI